MMENKQTGWFHTEVKFENSFKFWFALQWQNHYIQLFAIGFILTILELFNLGWVNSTINENFAVGGTFGGVATILGLSIPLLEILAIAYAGFWQFWLDIKNTNS